MLTDVYLSGIVGAVITALATLSVPLLARNYAVKVINTTPVNSALPLLAGSIVKLFGSMEISEAKCFVVREGEAYLDPHIDFAISYGTTPKENSKWYQSDDYFISIVLPGLEIAEKIVNPQVGWTRLFEHKSIRYRIILIKDDIRLTFAMRILDEDIAHRKAQG